MAINEKQFKRIAQIIHKQELLPGNHPDDMAIDKGLLAEELAKYFDKESIHFSKGEFLSVCYYGE